MPKLIFEGLPTSVKTEDSGSAKIAEYDLNHPDLFIRFQSCDQTEKHVEFNKFNHRKVRITIETIDD